MARHTITVADATRVAAAREAQSNGVSAAKPVTTASITVPDSTVTVTGTLRLPAAGQALRGVLVVLHWGLGAVLFDNTQWQQVADDSGLAMLRMAIADTKALPPNPPPLQQAIRNASLGGGRGLLLLLQELAKQSGRPDVADAPLVLWGHSAAGSFATTFAAMHPERTLAFIRYHSHRRELPTDLKIVATVPALLLAGTNDAVAGVEDTRQLFEEARASGAPWTLAVEPGVSHGTKEELIRASVLMLPWLSAVLQQSNPPNTAGGGLFVHNATGQLRSEAERSSKEHSWLPSKDVAAGWRAVTGK